MHVRFQNHHAWLETIEVGEHEALGELRAIQADERDGFVIYPGCLESMIQLAVGEFLGSEQHDLYVPSGVKTLTYDLRQGVPHWAYIRYERQEEQLIAEGYLLSEEGEVLVHCAELILKKVPVSGLSDLLALKTMTYQSLELTWCTD